MSYTKNLAKYISEINYNDIPKDVILRAKHLTLQTIGVSLAAVNTDLGQRAINLGKIIGSGSNEASIWGTKDKVSASAASLANGTLADALDWEDCSWTGHPSACAVPAGIALAEKINASGKDYLLALVSAYELYERVAMAVQPGPNFGWMTKGWGLTSWAVYASAGACAKLLNLDKAKMENLIGIAGAQTPTINVLPHITRSDFYHFQWGLGSLNGLVAAQLAQVGISNLPDYLDGDSGYWCTMTDDCKWEWYNKNLGSQWLIMETLLKHWPTNMWIQQPLDIMHDIIKEYQIKPSDIKSIVVSPSIEARWITKPNGYDSVVDAQFSIPYCISAMIHDPELKEDWYSEKNRHNKSILELSTKITSTGNTYRLQECFEMFQKGEYPYYKVELESNDGRKIVKELDIPKGHPKKMLNIQEFKDRFMLTAIPTLTPEQAEKLYNSIMDLDNIQNINSLTSLF